MMTVKIGIVAHHLTKRRTSTTSVWSYGIWITGMLVVDVVGTGQSLKRPRAEWPYDGGQTQTGMGEAKITRVRRAHCMDRHDKAATNMTTQA